MQLDPGIAVSCGETGGSVRPLGGGTPEPMQYTERMLNRIKVRPGDLVAVDHATRPPQIVFRWWHAQVKRVEGEQAIVERNVAQASASDPRTAEFGAVVPASLRAAVQPGVDVFFTHADGIERVIATASAADSDDAATLRADLLPQVAAFYTG